MDPDEQVTTSYSTWSTNWIFWSSGTTSATVTAYTTGTDSTNSITQGQRWVQPTYQVPDGYAERARARAAAREKAQQRALRLLRSMLSPAQRKSLEAHGTVLVRGSAGGLYRVRPRGGQTERLDDARVVASYCLHDYTEDERMPPADLALAHMLLLAADEPAFLEQANHYGPRGGMTYRAPRQAAA